MIETVIGGALIRMLPELAKFFESKTANAHELAMLDRQIELEKAQARSKRQEISLNGEVSEVLGLLDARKEALRGQMQLTGIKIVDALNFLVRPITTYYLLLLYGISKTAMAVVAYHAGVDAWVVIQAMYTSEDRDILGGILGFWFVGRVIDKRK